MTILIVGAGLSGCVLAEQFATKLNKQVHLIEKRNHIGGNCYDYIDPKTNLLINQYGPHFFHTNSELVWLYVTQFGEWISYTHKVMAYVDNQFVNLPPNMNTINQLFNEHLNSSEQCQAWYDRERVHDIQAVQAPQNPQNSEEMALTKCGLRVYEKIFKNYTYKQWNKYPKELNPSVLSRIPIRTNCDDRYFNDQYQAQPIHGFTQFIQHMITHPNITVQLNTDFADFVYENATHDKYEMIIYTGPIDTYFADRGLPKLEYRSLRFEKEIHYNMNFYQPVAQVNYPELTVPYTRITEYKHILNQSSPHTLIVKEYSTDEGEPYYPIPNEQNLELYKQYQQLAQQEEQQHHVYFVGRLANYKYYNMDQAIENALHWFQEYRKRI